jgi:prophage maintenance system killer protein
VGRANSVVRENGTVQAFCPPEQVQGEIERLIDLYRGSADLHPVIRAAWLHHAFVSIHPFEDGNGRVARALSLLVLLRNRYAPLVVDRHSRADYISALEAATDGDPRPLVRLFARLEVVALRAELERPALATATGASAVEVANAYVARLRALRGENTADERAAGARVFASSLLPRVVEYLHGVGEGLDGAFTSLDPSTHHTVDTAAPGDERSGWWRAQIIRTAREAGFYTNITGGTWWANLRLTVLGQRLRYVVILQKVGHGETGVLALTIFAESVTDAPSSDPAAPQSVFLPLLKTSDAESVTFVYTDDVDQRWDDVRGTIDRTLAATVAAFASGLT